MEICLQLVSYICKLLPLLSYHQIVNYTLFNARYVFGCLIKDVCLPWQAYVRPEEELIESLTVREHLYYSALLQLPSRLPLSKKLSRVDACISEMDLEELVSIRIGCSHKTGGLSRFERKRLSLAVHMLSCPYLLFLEEPTYGLDR